MYHPSLFTTCPQRIPPHDHSSECGGNPLLFRRMDPRIREDDKKGPFELSHPPEPFSVRRGVLLRGAFPECFCRGRESIPSSRRCTTRCLLSSASQRRA